MAVIESRFKLEGYSRKVLRETFGSLKHILKRSSQEMKDELRKQIYP
ncbi:MAG TPA: hypothetical protein VJK51_04850 [Candidatus Nanoarchaeia archaeon]|nr:hypothetical protein [Candidatus Nanoarchaeia archaeon]